MNQDTLLGLLAQVPLVGIFIIFVLTTRKEDRAEREKRDAALQNFMQDQRQSDRTILTMMVERLERLQTKLEDHDKETRKAITTMEERTRPRKLQ